MRRIAFFAALCLVLGAHATPAPAQSVFDACEADLRSYCSNVTPGHGRLLSCLYAHEDKISVDCDANIGDVADLIDVFFARLRHVTQECGEDIIAQCHGVEVGQGRIFSCLHEKRDALSQGCLAVVDAVELPED